MSTYLNVLDLIVDLEETLPVVAGTERHAYPAPVVGAVVSGDIYGALVSVKRCAQRVTYRLYGQACTLDALIAALMKRAEVY